jgi:hypothetical protein
MTAMDDALTPASTDSDVEPWKQSSHSPDAPKAFAFSSPYRGCWLVQLYRQAGAFDLFGGKVETAKHLGKLLAQSHIHPRLMILGNFIEDRHLLLAKCRRDNIDSICSEDGFFPHYETLHADPLGFCWESSLCRMVFRGATDRQYIIAQRARAAWTQFKPLELPSQVRVPFVLWPLQLIGDQVNRWDMNVVDWSDMITHFRLRLPPEIQLVVKPHPRSKLKDQPRKPLSEQHNTIILDQGCDLRTLISLASGVAAANSTVLLEARLMFHKPVYSYARSWFTNHTELCYPIALAQSEYPLRQLDVLENNSLLCDEWLSEYTDWFLSQLLARQLRHSDATSYEALHQWVMKRTYKAYMMHGEEIFSDE